MKFLVEADYSSLTIQEDVGSRDLFISGIFAEAELKNRNGRIYPRAVMESAVRRYNDDYVLKKRALSELSHPENRPKVKPELASHLITELKMDGTTVHGKAKVLNTPQGNILRGLLEGGVQFGVSTRGLGSVSIREGCTYVEPDFVIMAVDAVTDPSSINAFVEAVNESAEWLITDDGQVIEKMKKAIKQKAFNESKAIDMFNRFMGSLKS